MSGYLTRVMALSLALSCLSSWARADEDVPEPEVSVEERLRQLEDELYAVRAELAQRKAEEGSLVSFVPFGYLDFGFFAPSGDGSGWVQDVGNQWLPELAGRYGWVFVGDILAPAVNSRGEASDLGNSPGVVRFDSVGSRGAPGFIINEVEVGLRVGLGERLLLVTELDVVPRSGDEFSLGDFVQLPLAQVEWLVDDAGHISLFAGKIESAFGIEYKERRAPDRFGVTPSLVARYTTGTALGLKVRAKLWDDRLILAAALTNGSFVVEPFHFFREIDSNAGKTVTGRVALKLPLEALGGASVEVGVSGQVGSQDRALDSAGLLWLVGVDLEARVSDFTLKAQWIRGGAPGRDAGDVWMLELHDSGYIELTARILPWLGVLVRGCLRDAFVALRDERAYVTHSGRLTGGVQLSLGPQVTLKVEYLKNLELGDIPKIDNDMLTSSAVFHY